MSAAKAIRLSKVARELNVGKSTIVEFAKNNGFELPENPNAKVEPALYEKLLEKFQPDMLQRQKKEEAMVQAEKDRAELFGKEKREEEPAPKISEDGSEEDTVLIKSNVIKDEKEEKPVSSEKKETAEKEEAIETRADKEQEATEAKKKEEESKSVEEEKETPAKEKKPLEPKTEEKKKADKEGEKEEDKDEKKDKGGLKVLRKIDVDKKPGKKKAKTAEEKKEEKKEEPSDKKSKEAPEEEKAQEKEKPVKEDKPQKEETSEKKPEEEKKDSGQKEEVTPAAEKKDSEEVKEEKEEKPAEAKDESNLSWEEKRVKLKGLTVQGKVDLSQFKKKKPVASSSDSAETARKKRKRKRIRTKSGEEQQGQSQSQSQSQSQGQGQSRPQDQNKRKRKRKTDKVELDDKQIQNQIKETLNRLTGKDAKSASKTKIKKKKKEILRQKAEERAAEEADSDKTIEVTEFITANELANLMDVTVTEVITACMSLGMMVSINQRIDAETISLVADEFGFDVTFTDVEMDEPSLEEPDKEESIAERPPIVTIMGHVDHGKTSLLDYIRESNIIAGESGGITQHIGAYEVTLENGKQITFLDTPGHEAFTAMRARGAKVTDIAIIVIAADDKVMPQTKEAISHAQAAGVPMIFAFNKIDKETANPDLIRQQLADENVMVEEWGGKYQAQEISAKTGLNVDELLERVLLEAEILELKADPDKRAIGTVIEASLDRGRGIVTTILVESGTLRVGDMMLAGAHWGRVKAMFNERGQKIEEAGPSTPVQMLGFDGAPAAGDKFYVTKSDAEAKEIATQRQQLIREQGIRATKHITLDEIGRRIAVGNFKELNVIVKGDVDGSVEALSDSLLKLSTEEIQVNVIHKAVGQISEGDVLLASASDAVIIGFQVRPSLNAKGIAEKEQIDIRLYSVIYDAIEELKAAMEGMLEPTTEEKIVANVEIRETFKITKVGTIAGCMVISGKINRNNKIRVIREGVVKHDGKLASLKRFKDDVKEVAKGYECGIQIEKYNDIKEGDIIEAYEEVEVKRKL